LNPEHILFPTACFIRRVMKIKNENYVTNILFNDRKLTAEEIQRFPLFANANDEEKTEIAEVVYNISLVLYKLYINGSTELL
jgi:hypothetical protein